MLWVCDHNKCFTLSGEYGVYRRQFATSKLKVGSRAERVKVGRSSRLPESIYLGHLSDPTPMG